MKETNYFKNQPKGRIRKPIYTITNIHLNTDLIHMPISHTNSEAQTLAVGSPPPVGQPWACSHMHLGIFRRGRSFKLPFPPSSPLSSPAPSALFALVMPAVSRGGGELVLPPAGGGDWREKGSIALALAG